MGQMGPLEKSVWSYHYYC